MKHPTMYFVVCNEYSLVNNRIVNDLCKAITAGAFILTARACGDCIHYILQEATEDGQCPPTRITCV